MLRSLELLIFVSLFTSSVGAAAQAPQRPGPVSGGSAHAASPRPACSVRIKITDEDGAQIGNAYVLIHGDRKVNLSQQVSVDATGTVKTTLRPGLYDLFVSSAGFVPVAQILDTRSCKPVDINLMMTFDSEHADSNGF